MSDTDKTDPYWVKENHDPHRRIDHDVFCEEFESRWGSYHYPNYRYAERIHPCNVSEKQHTRRHQCTYGFPVSSWHSYFRYYYGSAPKWYRQHEYENPKRVEERDKLRNAVKQYNGSGDTDDIVFDHINHRHSAGYNYW